MTREIPAKYSICPFRPSRVGGHARRFHPNGYAIVSVDAARKNRWGHRDATMILVAYPHGFRCLSVPVGTSAVNALVRSERQIARVSGLFRFPWDDQLLAMVLHFSGYIVPPVTDAWSTYDPHNSAIGIAGENAHDRDLRGRGFHGGP
jgi:hypothetical protein